MFNLKRAGGLTSVAGAALLAGCSTLAPDPSTTRKNSPDLSGIVETGSNACVAANIYVVRSNSIGQVFNSTVINGLTYPSYEVRNFNSPFSHYNSYVRANQNVLPQSIVTSNTGEIFTLIPLEPPTKANSSLLGIAGLTAGSLIGGGSARIAAAVLGASAGIYSGQKLDQGLQQAYLNAATRCAYDYENGAGNRKGGPRDLDKAFVHPLTTWGGRIDKYLPVAPR